MAEYEGLDVQMQPAGANGEIQFNNNGALGSSATLKWLAGALNIGNTLNFNGNEASIQSSLNNMVFNLAGVTMYLLNGYDFKSNMLGSHIKAYSSWNAGESKMVYGSTVPYNSNSGIAFGYISDGASGYYGVVDIMVEGIRVARFRKDGTVVDQNNNPIIQPTLSFSNGVTKSGNNIKLGGSITESTPISLQYGTLSLNGNGNFITESRPYTDFDRFYTQFMIQSVSNTGANTAAYIRFDKNTSKEAFIALKVWDGPQSLDVIKIVWDRTLLRYSNEEKASLTLADLIARMNTDWHIPCVGKVADMITAAIGSAQPGGYVNPFQGDWSAALGTLPTLGADGLAIKKGYQWRISSGGTIAGIGALVANDVLYARVDNASLASDFFATEGNQDYAAALARITAVETGKQNTLGYTAENAANKSDDGTMDENSATKYPTQKAVREYVAANGGGITAVQAKKIAKKMALKYG
jgi:hypothetical protein